MITIKLIKGRHFYDRLYKAGIIYHVKDEVGVYLLNYKNVDKTPRFKRMVKRSEIDEALEVAEPGLPAQLVKRKRGRPKKSPVVNKVVDETPVKEPVKVESTPVPTPAPEKPTPNPLKDVVLEQDLEEDFVEEEVTVEDTVEVYDDGDAEVQNYGDEV